MLQTKSNYTLALAVCAGLAASASAQTFQASGSDVLPGISGGKVITGAHLDATGADVLNVRVFGYSFQGDLLDPYFTQDPGFNAPAGGLPAASVFGFNIAGSLAYWSGSGPINFVAPPNGESLLYNFGINNRTLTGSSGAQAGFGIGTVAANGSLHKHLNAFLQGSNGTSDPATGGTFDAGIYMASFTLTDTGVADSDPIYLVYDNGLDSGPLDRAKFRTRNFSAPGSHLAGTVTNMIGLSPLPGEDNFATGGQVTVTGGNGNYLSEIDTLTGHQGIGSAAINHIGAEGRTFVMLWLTGSAADVNSLITSLDGQTGYDIAPATAGAADPLFADIQKLQGAYPGFSALAAFNPTTDNGALTWDFSGSAVHDGLGNITSFNVLVDKIAAVPEPGALTLLLLAAPALRATCRSRAAAR